MTNDFTLAEIITGIDEPDGVLTLDPAQPLRDCDECNSSHEAEALRPFPWKARFGQAPDGEIEFLVCHECEERLHDPIVPRTCDDVPEFPDTVTDAEETPFSCPVLGHPSGSQA